MTATVASAGELGGQFLQAKILFSHSETSLGKLHIDEICFSQPAGLSTPLPFTHDLDCSRPIPSPHEWLTIQVAISSLISPSQPPIICELLLKPWFYMDSQLVSLTHPIVLVPGSYEVQILVFASTGLVAKTVSSPVHVVHDLDTLDLPEYTF